MKKLWKWLRPRREQFAAANDARIGLPELERAVGSVEPAARLVLPRLLRRVVRLHTSLPGMGFRVPHSKTYVIPQKALLEIADRSEIGFGPAEDLPEDVILLERPSGEILEQRPRGEVLLDYWELLYPRAGTRRVPPPGQSAALRRGGSREAVGGVGQPGIRRDPQRAAARAIPAAALRRRVGLRRVRGRLPGHSLLPAVPDGQFLSGLGVAGEGGCGHCPGHRCGRASGGNPPARHARAGGTARGGTRRGRGLRRRSAGSDPRFREDAESRGHGAHWARGRRRSEKKYLLWSQRADAAGRPRQSGGGRHSPCPGRVLGPA